MSDARKKTCFVVSQIGGSDSPERIHADWVFDGILEPVFKTDEFSGFELIRADKINVPGLIDSQVIDFILNSELVIADLTKLNPNVFYEIGIRHVVQKPIIHINVENEKIPFDISLYRAISYSIRRHKDLVDAQEAIAAAVRSVTDPGYRVDNPITRARGRIKFEESATPTDRLLEDVILDLTKRLDMIDEVGNTYVDKTVSFDPTRHATLSRTANLRIRVEKDGVRVTDLGSLFAQIDQTGLSRAVKSVEEKSDHFVVRVEAGQNRVAAAFEMVKMLKDAGLQVAL